MTLAPVTITMLIILVLLLIPTRWIDLAFRTLPGPVRRVLLAPYRAVHWAQDRWLDWRHDRAERRRT